MNSVTIPKATYEALLETQLSLKGENARLRVEIDFLKDCRGSVIAENLQLHEVIEKVKSVVANDVFSALSAVTSKKKESKGEAK